MKTQILLLLLLFNLYVKAQNINNKIEEHIVNVDFSYPFSEINYCSFNKYLINSETKVENDEYIKLKQQLISSNFFVQEKSFKNYLKIKSKLSFIWNGERIILINYKTVNDKDEKNNLIFCTNKSFDLSILKSILNLSNDSFWQFYNSENNLNYPEINNLKPLVKDADGVLNIYKLAEVIEKNKVLLSKYMDE
jgi:hypothetical protein